MMPPTYNSVRPQMKSGDLIALSHYTWDSLYDLEVQVVRLATQSEFSHVAVLWCVADRVFVIEAVEPKIRIFPLSNIFEETDHKGFYWVPTETEMKPEELEFLLGKVGLEGYSKLQAIKAQLNLLDIGGDKLWECAELTIMARRLSGLELGIKATPSAVIWEAQKQGLSVHFVVP